MNEEIKKLLVENKWEVETIFANNTMFVAHRNYSTIIGYPKSDKFRENGVVEEGLKRRIMMQTRKKKWFSEQLLAKGKWIAGLLEGK